MELILIFILPFVAALLLLVLIHEFGHFATARALGVKVLEFGVGFPPRAFGFYTGKTRVMVDGATRFVNVDGVAGLRSGQLVKVSSTEDQDGNLVARVVEAPEPRRGLAARLPGRGGEKEQWVPDEYLKHEGKVRAVESNHFLLADMLYSVNWAPLGGFVRLAGESDPRVPQSLASKGVATRFLVLVAGPLMNAIFPIVIFAAMFMIPQDVVVGQVVVSRVSAGSPAEAAGILPGDLVLRADGHQIENQNDLRRATNLNGGSHMEWLIVRNGREVAVQVQPRFEQPQGQWRAGILISEIAGQVTVSQVFDDTPAQEAGLQSDDVIAEAGGRRIANTGDLIDAIAFNQDAAMPWVIIRGGRQQVITVAPRFEQERSRQWITGESTVLVGSHVESRSEPPWTAIASGFASTWELLVMIKQAIAGSFDAGAAPELSGPIGIAQVTGEVTRDGGLAGWLVITVLLSINLAILNILPLPMLDGGRLVFVMLEWVRRGKRIPPEKEGLVHLIGFVVLIGAVLVISANDINRLIQGNSFLGG